MSETDSPLPRIVEGYFEESRRPLTSLAFVLPWLVCYEVGVVVLGVQNGADVWMRQWLNLIGLDRHFLLPLLTVAILLGWHHVSRRRWSLRGSVLAMMLVECCLSAVVLWLVFQAQSVVWKWAATPAHWGPRAASWIGFLGAGIYEELLFRMILLSALIALLRRFLPRPAVAVTVAVALSSIAFAAAHHVSIAGVVGEPFVWSSFTFRTAAGVFFSVVFLYRGFGIAAGSHAAYDIFAAA